MENKAILEGQLMSVPKLTEFNSVLFRVKNTRSFKKKDGTMQELTYTATVSARGPVAQAVATRFTKGDFMRIEGNLSKKNTKRLDEEGREIYEDWINAYKVDAMVHQTNLAPLPENLKTTEATQKQKQEYTQVKPSYAKATADRQPTPVFKKQPSIPYNSSPQPASEIEFNDEDPFNDRLPF